MALRPIHNSVTYIHTKILISKSIIVRSHVMVQLRDSKVTEYTQLLSKIKSIININSWRYFIKNNLYSLCELSTFTFQSHAYQFKLGFVLKMFKKF